MIIDKNRFLVQNANSLNIVILECGYATTGIEWKGFFKSPPYCRLYYIVGGDPYIIDNGHKVSLEVGNCYLFPTGYHINFSCNTSNEQVYFHLNIYDSANVDIMKNTHNYMSYRPDAALFKCITESIRGDDLTNAFLCIQAAKYSVMSLLAVNKIELCNTNISECVRKAMQYIHDNLNIGISVAELARITYVSERTLAKKFKREIGMTVWQYICREVLNEAEHLLISKDMPIARIGENLGFCNQFYFSASFKKRFGSSPSEYKKAIVLSAQNNIALELK